MTGESYNYADKNGDEHEDLDINQPPIKKSQIRSKIFYLNIVKKLRVPMLVRIIS